PFYFAEVLSVQPGEVRPPNEPAVVAHLVLQLGFGDRVSPEHVTRAALARRFGVTVREPERNTCMSRASPVRHRRQRFPQVVLGQLTRMQRVVEGDHSTLDRRLQAAL